jgi:hypothetical protein
VRAYVRHHNSGAADPRSFTDVNARAGERLIAEGHVRLGRAVRGRAAWDVRTGGDERVALDMDEAQMATGADVHVGVETRTGVAHERAEPDRSARIHAGDRAREERASEVVADEAREERQHLHRAFERAVADERSPQRVAEEHRHHDQRGCGSERRLDRLTHARRLRS